ncbi:hypothetical protein DB29_01201 [Shouchella clausii]|nr:hypothetical protein DB29_01201 [Shouchella clausii]
MRLKLLPPNCYLFGGPENGFIYHQAKTVICHSSNQFIKISAP